MNKLFFKVIVVIAITLFFNSVVFAVSTTNKYEVRLTKFELYNSDTAQWVTIFEGSLSSPLDIASVSSNQLVGSFLSGLTVPDGTYSRARATPSTTFLIRGNVTSGATTYYTTAGTVTVAGRTASRATLTAASVANCTTVVLASDINVGQGQAFTGGSLTVTNGIPSHKVRVSFDLSDALTVDTSDPANPVIFPGGPTITLTLVQN